MAGIAMDWVDIVGWIGAVLVLAAYIAVSTDRLDGSSVPYQVMNVFGATGMLINGYARGAFPSATINVIWIAMGLYVLVKALAKRRPAA